MTVASPDAAAGRAAVRTGPRDRAMRLARTCYDHLAGRVAVAIADAMVARGELELSADGGGLTAGGEALLTRMGVDMSGMLARGRSRRVFCRPCLDWSERRAHIAGAVGAALLDNMIDRLWIRRTARSRAVTVTPSGRRELDVMFDLPASVWE